MQKIYKLLIVSVVALMLASVGFGQASGEAGAAERRAREIAAFITSGDRQAFRKYVEANFGAEFVKMPIDRHLNFMSSMHDHSRGFEVHSVQDSKPNEATLLVRNKLSGDWDALLVRIEPETPYKIVGIGLRPPKVPAGEAKKLSVKETGRDLEEFAKKMAASDVFSGAVLLAKDGEVLYKGAFGLANKDFNAPNRTDTKFNLGSMNKMFTGVAIAQLVEKGKMSFDDLLSKFIPDFPTEDAAKKIRIKHLLSHTGGLGGYFTPRYDAMSRATEKCRRHDETGTRGRKGTEV